MDRARADDDEQTVILTREDGGGVFSGGRDDLGGTLRRAELRK
jgi:hypothetical protein